LLFPLALLGQLVGLHWKHWLPGAENMTNIYSGVKAAVYTFMSHII
jgi:light-harvesting complex 1 beta chain